MRFGQAIVMLSAAGCLKSKPPPAKPPPPPKVILAILQAESDTFPGVAQAINDATLGVKLAGVDETVHARVSIEVVQLQVECVDPTPVCLKQAGSSLSADRMLFARIEAGTPAKPKPKPRRRPRAAPVKVSVTLFDVDAGRDLAMAEQQFETADAAAEGARALVDQAIKVNP